MTAATVRNILKYLLPRGVSRSVGDRLFHTLALLIGWALVALLAFLAMTLAGRASSSIARFGFSFLWSSSWDVPADLFGALPFIYGTLVTSLLALAIALPISLGAAAFLSEMAPRWLSVPLSFLVELLAAVPSVVYGLWGFFVLVPFLRDYVDPVLGNILGFLPLFQGPQYGSGIMAGGVTLSIMIIPTISAISRDAMRAVPRAQREGALALGATPWETTRRVVLRIARPGVIAATLLGLGRALGETMAVTMVIGNRVGISASLFSGGSTLASIIINELVEAFDPLHIAALVELALVLLLITLATNVIARLLLWRLGVGR